MGRDVESIIRDLTEAAVAMVRQEYQEQLRETAEQRVEERLLDALLPETGATRPSHALIELLGLGGESNKEDSHEDRRERLRERFREMLRNGELEDRPVEIEVEVRSMPFIEILSPAGHEEMDINLRELLGNMLPKQRRRRRVTVAEARQIPLEEEMERLTDMDRIVPEAIRRVEQSGIVFLDEIDKIAGRESTVGPDVSREGVQRDILPIVEGCTVTTKYGPVRTDHILFIAAGAFHVSKPSDLIPELQGRFPIRVELNNLTEEDFRRILTDPKNSLIRQYAALLATEGVTLEFTEDAITEMAKVAYELNSRMENIGARRLHTILERVLETISFTAPERQGERIVVDRDYVREQLRDILENVDLSRYIL
ncbi:MAG: ATP-dependent protease ATPase subunit HslU [Candidatus Poribacteria bacterium]|nr:MAG: ATP-dependent protease ATPase subunit HslU [Candidatus Poribacteria bacterium]